MINRLLKMIIVFIIILTLTTGCWDRVEINERLFIMSVAMDLYKDEDENGEGRKTKKPSENKFTMTYVMPNFENIQTKTTGKSPKVKHVLKTVAKNPYEGSRQVSSKATGNTFFKHMKVAVMGLDVTKNPIYFRQMIDALNRQDDITRKLELFVAEGRGDEIVEANPKIQPLVASYLQDLTEKPKVTSTYIPQNLEEVVASLKTSKTALIPKVTVSSAKDEVKVEGSALIKDYKFIDWLGVKETRAVSILKKKSNNDIFNVIHKNITIPYITHDIHVFRNLRIEDDKIVMDIKVTTEGGTSEYILNGKPELSNDNFLKELEKKAEQVIKGEIDYTLNKLQKELNTDVVGIGDYISKFEPKLWKEIKNDWDHIFPEVKINVSVDARFRRTGSIK
ncbi:spore germination protein A3 [Gottschalkia purinilytica]|uniref:Spore germination protein A3 n=1 Tax=Gottschalkia purinilytica TaxID=1503 RepID=A0A0L0WE73_GOTPU|nr:Ger(x)C family spore germination protein [Gottschalkia purinilytica]KNF09778.1 spore germination protein A3 [Gottschalkia purinilytica]